MNSLHTANHRKRNLLGYLIKTIIISSASLIANMSTANASNLAQVSKSLNGATLLGHEAPTEILTFKVWLKPSNNQELKSFLSNVYNPSSSEYAGFSGK